MGTRRPLRIGLVSAYFRPHVGGVERFTETLAEALVQRGHEVAVFCCRTDPNSPRTERVGGYDVLRIPATNRLERHLRVPYPVPSPLGLRRLARALRGFDVVHVHEARYATAWTGLYAASAANIPSVLTQHVGFEPQGSATLDLVQSLSVRASAHVARKATLVTTVNTEVASWVRREWRVRDVRVLPVGVEPAEVVGRRSEFGLPEERFLVLFVGRDVAKKNLPALLDAIDPAFELVAVTDAQPAPRRGLHLLPFMAADQLARLRTCVDAFVLPSSHGEGLPLALVEAMVAGLPVVTTMLPGFERVLDPADVLVVEPTATSLRVALCTLASDRLLRRRLSRASARVAETQFGTERFVDAYEDLYVSLLGRAE